MIRDFWVKNYRSIGERQGLSFVTKGPASELVVEVAKGVFLYKLGILFGPNASGKSNLLQALRQIFHLMVSPQMDASRDVEGYTPFALTPEDPVEMHVSFYVDSVRYDYDVAYNSRALLSERLYYYPKGYRALFYERHDKGEGVQSDIKFGAGLRLQDGTQEAIRVVTLNNHSVLSVCGKVSLKEDIAPIRSLWRYVMTYFHEVDGDSDSGVVERLVEAYRDPRKRRFYSLMLRKADLNIEDYQPVVRDEEMPDGLGEILQRTGLSEGLKKAVQRATRDSVTFVNSSERGSFDVPLEFQSRGTLRYVTILDALFDLITGPHVYYIDEMGEDLHYDLLYFYLSVFIFNSSRAQLLITSQETSLLSQDMINDHRGVVWFVEKNRDTASSEYAKGDSFGLHKNLSLYNSYRSGRLGAKPGLGSIFIDLEE